MSDSNIADLLALKAYEKPEPERTEKNILNIMRQVRQADNLPGFLVLPDRSFYWAFSQPRYGVAALFILFLGLHLMYRPAGNPSLGPAPIRAPEPAAAVLSAAVSGTNRTEKLPVPGVPPRTLYTPRTPPAVPEKPVLTSFSQ